MIPQRVFEEILLQFLTPVRPYLSDPRVSEIMVNGPSRIFIERNGLVELTESKFENQDALDAALRNIAQYAGKNLDDQHPILEARLPDGSRVEAVLAPIAAEGPYLSIRRFFTETLTLEKLIEFGSLTPDGASLLHGLVASKFNVIVAGGTGSGKTSLLNALSKFIPEHERVIVIEDARELQLRGNHILQLEARPADPKGRGAVTIRDLFRASLRMRPDRIVVGEIRGGEALDLIQAMTSGHGGCLSTLHATFPRDTLSRLETMSLMSDVNMPLVATRLQVASAVHFVVQTARLMDGSRRVTHITEVVRFDVERGVYELRDIFAREFRGFDPSGRLISEFLPTGHLPDFLPQMHEHGVDLPRAVYEAAKRQGRME